MADKWLLAFILSVCLGIAFTQNYTYDVCASNPCLHDGTCTQLSEDYYQCVCATGFTDEDCEVIYDDVCLSNPCLNGGTCSVDRNYPNQYNCTCADGFTNDDCSEHIAGQCISNPCLHGGTCSIGSDGNVACACLGLFGGDNCEYHLTEGQLRANETGCCLSGPCRNGGTCRDSGGSFSCECRDGYTGLTCEIRDGAFCNSNPCQHGGTCHEETQSCTCDETQFSGSYCEVFTQGVCLSDPCIYGDCVATEGGNSYQCQCLDSFTGSQCEIIGFTCLLSGAQGYGGNLPLGLLAAGLLLVIKASN